MRHAAQLLTRNTGNIAPEWLVYFLIKRLLRLMPRSMAKGILLSVTRYWMLEILYQSEREYEATKNRALKGRWALVCLHKRVGNTMPALGCAICLAVFSVIKQRMDGESMSEQQISEIEVNKLPWVLEQPPHVLSNVELQTAINDCAANIEKSNYQTDRDRLRKLLDKLIAEQASRTKILITVSEVKL